MRDRLVPGAFNAYPCPLPLSTGQERGACAVFAATLWYSKQGEQIGHGDLSTLDLRRIMWNLQPSELFFVLPGQADQAAPTVSVDDLLARATIVIARHTVYRLIHDEDKRPREMGQIMAERGDPRDTVPATWITINHAQGLIAEASVHTTRAAA